MKTQEEKKEHRKEYDKQYRTTEKRRTYAAEYYQKNKEHLTQLKQERRNRGMYKYDLKKDRDRRLNHKRLAVEYLGGKCERCGIEDSCLDIYDFHHINSDEKDFNLGNIMSKKWEIIKTELDKCQLLCSNCHRKIHSGENNGNKSNKNI